MDVSRNMELFRELMLCGSNISTWCYDGEGRLLQSNCPDEALFSSAFHLFGASTQMLERAKISRMPVTLGTALGLQWGAAYEYRQDTLHRIWVIGPLLTSNMSLRAVEIGFKHYSNLEISIAWKSEFLRALPRIPVIQNIVYTRSMLQLHYCLTGEHIDSSDLDSSPLPEEDIPSDNTHRDRHQIWRTEQALLQMVRLGDLDYHSALNDSIMVSDGVPVDTEDPLRRSKTSIIVFTSLVCRAAMEGGLSPEIAYSLGDTYIQEVESATSLKDLGVLPRTMYEDFIRRVRQCRTNPRYSPQVQKCCDYIELHLSEKIHAADLAALVGYTEYYLTRKFHAETNCSVNDYIKFAKIERAKTLLQTTNQSIQQISDALGFNTRNYFSRVFNDIVGMTPAAYRKKVTRF